MLDFADIDALAVQVRSDGADLAFDLNADKIVDDRDHTNWVHDLRMTWFGDANFDGLFGTKDLVQVFLAGTYETAEDSGWGQGDWNGDGEYTSSDLVVALADGGYQQRPRPVAVVVPEPSGIILLLLSLRGFLRRARTARNRQLVQDWFLSNLFLDNGDDASLDSHRAGKR